MDISARALLVLARASLIACEDTRVTGKLLHHLGVKARMIRYDDHADERAREGILALAVDSAVALVSDAGTPLISDPGFRLVREARERGIAVTSLPGPSAAIVALTLAGLPTDRFVFAGFLPSKAKARGEALAEFASVRATLVFYETGPRLVASLEAVGEVLPGREVAVARELTKLFEECRTWLDDPEAELALALVCDAGTPLISDPGYRLVRAARAAGVMVTSLPGPSAAVVALTLAGLPTDRFLFAGFLPSKAAARLATLGELARVRATLVFYESGPRLVATLGAVAEALPGREVAVARELTKLHEECRTGSAGELAAHYTAHPPRGEIVLLVGPPSAEREAVSAADTDELLIEALAHEKPSQAASRLAREHGLDRKTLYARALELRPKPTSA